MLGGLMLADFRYDPVPSNEDVVVELFWEQSKRMGKILAPTGVEDAVDANLLPDLEPMAVIAAVAYAMVLAAQSSRKLRLSGDTSVWPAEWGSLVRAH